ncbi:MAG: FecR domain-containing protein [Pseudomonadota bacterium]
MGYKARFTISAALGYASLVGIVTAIGIGAANSQQTCELVPDPNDPGWEVLSCRPDVGISASNDASFALTDHSGDGLIDTIELDAGAVRTRVEPVNGPSNFQIRTRQAIVSVRGTDWATAISDAGTEVFVVKGEVQVVDVAQTDEVILTRGLGVDVPDAPPEPVVLDEAPTDDADLEGGDGVSAPAARAFQAPALAPLEAMRWGEARAADLLARFPGS